MEVQINRGRILANRLLYNIRGFGIILLFLIVPSLRDMLGIAHWVLASIITAVVFIGFCIYEWLYCKTLKYEIWEGQLSCSHQIITKRKSIAKLQVINNIRIYQGLVDKLFDLFTVEISYGFSQGGYRFYFHYLSEQEADRVSNMIRPKGRLVHIT